MPDLNFIPIIEKSGSKPKSAIYEFHISRNIRTKYDFDEYLFATNGNVVFANFQAVRAFTQKLNVKREGSEKLAVGQVNAMGLLDEIYHFILRQYELKVNPAVFSRAVLFIKARLDDESLNKTLIKFIEQFPPVSVYKGEITSEEYLNGTSEGRSNAEITLEELMLLHFANFNPANSNFKEFFNDQELLHNTKYKDVLSYLEFFFQNEKPYGPDNQFIFDLLRTPILNNPDNLEAQIKFILDKWTFILDEKYTKMLLMSMDLIKEDIRFSMFGGGEVPTVVPKYLGTPDDADILTLGKSGYKYGADTHTEYLEPEKFTPDVHWMPQVVLLAKNIYVWLDQLSKKYEKHIHRLDQIPDTELDIIASWNFTGLWLIGLWERSKASQKIKQIMGNPEAVSSAYSLYDYVIAEDLGGETAFQNLNHKCMKRGIRLASDMVPNHMGIFSKWVIERPDYFIQAQYPPFPGYNFSGPDLSDDPNVQIRIEDGYWSRSDAAVVFQRVDNRNGEVRYIYHGNDGTNMPWNDTAQLNMLTAEVREAVIQTIFHVARKTSIIRFDAAMTLAKKHFQRLWYPQPGTGGDIPSRADHALTREEFDAFFPKEFWREVVDRINQEMPDTLLLAEAFWLMEGYFVRTLGMHRVYNSAFMHMIMKEENSKYRDLITNTLEFNPEILKRYVNFMSNPDEETAIKQFGTDDKYFGSALLMVTLPGLPMFGHGQIEGFTEKYGMEYKRAYYNEIPNRGLIERHEREIFPLMKKRYMFAEVNHFWFYDFIDRNGHINENVFAYSNRYGNDKAVVVYNNKYEETAGHINYSTGKISSDNRTLDYRNLASALDLKIEDNIFYIFKEHVSQLEFIRSAKELNENGIYVELNSFKYQVFLDFREVYDNTGEYENLRNYLNGSGTRDLIRTITVLRLSSIHEAYYNLFNNKVLTFIENYYNNHVPEDAAEKIRFYVNKYQYLLTEIRKVTGRKIKNDTLLRDFEHGILAIRNLNEILEHQDFQIDGTAVLTEDFRKSVVLSKDSNYPVNTFVYLNWIILYNLGNLEKNDAPGTTALKIIDELLLNETMENILRRLGRSEHYISQEILLIKILLKYDPLNRAIYELHERVVSDEKLFMPDLTAAKKLSKNEVSLLEKLLLDSEVKKYIGANYYNGEWYFSKENLEDLLNWLLTINLIHYFSTEKKYSVDDPALNHMLMDAYHLNKFLKQLSEQSEYKISNLFDNILRGKTEEIED